MANLVPLLPYPGSLPWPSRVSLPRLGVHELSGVSRNLAVSQKFITNFLLASLSGHFLTHKSIISFYYLKKKCIYKLFGSCFFFFLQQRSGVFYYKFTSEPLRASIRVSSDFTLFRHSSPSFGSQQIRSYSNLSHKRIQIGRGCTASGSPLSLSLRPGGLPPQDSRIC